MTAVRREFDSLGEVDVPADRLWGAQTQRSLEHFSIGQDLIPREMITAYATLKKAAANANHAGGRLDAEAHKLIVQACDEILAGRHHDMFPLHVWMTGSGTQFNMNVNEVISNRCCQLAGTELGSKAPVHPNDHVRWRPWNSLPTDWVSRATVFPRWGELTVRIDDDTGSRYEIIAVEPVGVDMSKVAATMSVIDEVCDGRLDAEAARSALEAIARFPPVSA